MSKLPAFPFFQLFLFFTCLLQWAWRSKCCRQSTQESLGLQRAQRTSRCSCLLQLLLGMSRLWDAHTHTHTHARTHALARHARRCASCSSTSCTSTSCTSTSCTRARWCAKAEAESSMSRTHGCRHPHTIFFCARHLPRTHQANAHIQKHTNAHYIL